MRPSQVEDVAALLRGVKSLRRRFLRRALDDFRDVVTGVGLDGAALSAGDMM